MADKKFKTGVNLQSTVKISSETAERALILDASGNLISSTVTDAELAHVSGVTSAIQTQLGNKVETSTLGANSGVATLDAGGKLSSGQIPAIAITSTFVVATEIAQLALTVQEGDVAVRSDENKSYIALNADNADMGDWQVLLTPTDAVLSVNSQTGAVVLDADDISDAATTNKFVTATDITNLGNLSGTNSGDEVAASTTVAGISEIATSAEIDTGTDDTRTISPLGLAGSQLQSDVSTNNAKVSADGLVTTHSDVTSAGSGIIISSAERTKLTNIEALADVTDATNVAAAGATMDTDASLAGNSYFLDEDNMASDSATQVASQQSIKAYVDSQSAAGGNLSAGDIKETSFSGALDTATNLDVTEFAFANGSVRSFSAHVSVLVDAAADLYEIFDLMGIQKAAGWDMSVGSVGDDSLVSFSITAAGQIQYSKATTATWVSTTIKFRADTTSI